MEPDILNEHFNATTQRFLGTTPTSYDNLKVMIDSLHFNMPDSFCLRKVTHKDSSTGPDQLPVKCGKLVAEIITFPLTDILNEYVQKNSSPSMESCPKYLQYQRMIHHLRAACPSTNVRIHTAG